MLLALTLAVLIIPVGYIAYVVFSYRRIPDHYELKVCNVNEQPLKTGRPLKAVSWNIGFGAYSDDYSFFMNGGTESRAFSEEAVLENIESDIVLLKNEDPDIIMLEEVDTDSTRSYHVDQSKMIQRAFSDRSAVFCKNYDSTYLMWPIFKPHGASRSGILTLVRGKMDSSIRLSLPIENGFRKFLDLDRCYSRTVLPVDNGKKLYLYSLHLSAYTSDGSIATEQLKILLKDMQEHYHEGNYVIAGGDFNKDIWQDSSRYTGISGKNYSWAKPFPIELLPTGFVVADTLCRENPITSCRASETRYIPGKTFTVTLDAFIVSDNISVEESSVIDAKFRNSDHNPIRMTFRLNDQK